MQSLRRARRLARLVLAWFALSLGVAIAAPLVKPADIMVICSGAGAIKLMVKGDAGDKGTAHTLDCPLCSGLQGPPPIVSVALPDIAPLAHVLEPTVAARIAALIAAPLPARGPPAFLSS